MCNQLTQPCPRLRVRVDSSDGATLVAVSGELDIAAAPTLIALVQEAFAAPAHPVSIDASGVTFIDAAGLRGLLGGYHPEVMARLRFRRSSPALVRLLDMVGLQDLVEGFRG